ncbi:MAG TPA: hypothetical protein VM095_04880 [Pyrinomonadaceae bacterium]|nr:hypothetical protein [Pyrinomonadaceae bacterium]
MKTQKKLTFVVALAALALVAAACSKAGSSPTATAKAFYDATKAKDVAGMKNSLSKGSLAMMESFAKMDKKSLDDFLKEPQSTPPGTFEARNEVITGDTATLELKDEKGKWDKIPFVKENGQWKIALDKAFEQGLSEMSPSSTPGATPGGSMGGNTGNDTNSNTHGEMNSNKSESDDDDDTDNANNSNHDGH